MAPPPPAVVEPATTTTASQAMRLLGGLSPQELRRSIVMLQEHLQARERFAHTSSRLAAAALEFTMEGLHLAKRLAKEELPGRTVYGG